MAKKKKHQEPNENSAPVEETVVQDQVVEAPEEVAPEPQPEPVAHKKSAGTVSVKNVSRTWFVQPSSGVRVEPGQVRPMNDDGWLASQIKAKYLTRV